MVEDIAQTQVPHSPHKQFVQSLSGELNTVEQEARMVLPGIQALFGFQLIAVFNQGFKINLNQTEQIIHLIALLMVSTSAILVIAPAAYHRQANHQVSKHFIQLATRFLAWAMLPLALGSCLDIYLVSKIIVNSTVIAGILTFIIFLMNTWFWFILPRLHRNRIEDLPVTQIPK